jgi:hypothetical protein
MEGFFAEGFFAFLGVYRETNSPFSTSSKKKRASFKKKRDPSHGFRFNRYMVEEDRRTDTTKGDVTLENDRIFPGFPQGEFTRI